MRLVAGFAVLFISVAVWNLYQGDFENAKVGLVIGAIVAGFAFAMYHEEKETQTFLAFLLENAGKLKAEDGIEYRGTPLSSGTEVTQFNACFSFVILTIKAPSRFYIRSSHNTVGIGFIYSLVTLLFGWWGFPFGPIYTVQSLYKNLRGGEKTTLAQLLSEIENSEANGKQVGETGSSEATHPSSGHKLS